MKFVINVYEVGELKYYLRRHSILIHAESPDSNSGKVVTTIKSSVKDVRFAIASAVVLAIVLILLTSYYEYVPSNWKALLT